MAKNNVSNMVGSWAFLIGLIIAIIVAFVGIGVGTAWTLFIIGIIVGLLNIADKEVTPFLMAGAVLVIVSSLGSGNIPSGVDQVSNILQAINLLFVPATVVVAIKQVFSLAKN